VPEVVGQDSAIGSRKGRSRTAMHLNARGASNVFFVSSACWPGSPKVVRCDRCTSIRLGDPDPPAVCAGWRGDASPNPAHGGGVPGCRQDEAVERRGHRVTMGPSETFALFYKHHRGRGRGCDRGGLCPRLRALGHGCGASEPESLGVTGRLELLPVLVAQMGEPLVSRPT
jgi:hypothetical protein